MTNLAELAPDIKISINQTFGIDTDMKVDGFSKKSEFVPEIDNSYKFDRDTTLAIVSGFAFNKRVLIQGYHGTGKSTHIEQVAARLNWPCIRVNLDGHISRIDLIGKDAIVIKNDKQVTEFKEGILPWSIQNPVALVFDEYDAGRPDVMFIIQRVLEKEGNFTLLDQNKILKQNLFFKSVNKILYPSICSTGVNGCGCENSLHVIGVISEAAFSFIVHEPSAIIDLFKAISESSNFFKYLSISVSEW